MATKKKSANPITGPTTVTKEVSPQNPANIALSESKDRFRELFENAPLGYQSLDEDGVFIEVNQAWIESLGYKREEVIGRWFGDFLAPEYVGAFRDRFPLFKKEGKIHSEFEMLHKDGRRRFISFEGRIGCKPDGSFKQTHCILSDITERKNAEDALLKEQRFTQSLLDSLPGIFYLYTYPDLRLARWNKNHETLLGFSPEELRGRSIMDWHPPESKEAIRQAIETGFEKGHNEIESSILTKDGRSIPFLMTGVKFEAAGQLYLMGVGFNISERKRIEEALEESESRYKRLVNAVTRYIYVIQIENGRPVETTHGEGCVSVTGYTSDEYMTDPYLWHKMIHPKDREAVEEKFSRALAQNTAVTIEHRLIHKSGATRWVRNTAAPRLDTSGCLIAFDGLIEDITGRKTVEAQLRQVQRLESLGQIAGGVAHDYNNTLAAIMGYCTLAQMHVDRGGPAFRYLNDILALSDRATNITKSLLTFSRKQVVEIKPIDLNITVGNMEKLLLNLVGTDIVLGLNLPDRDLVVMGDTGQIEQVLMSLASNARDAMPEGGKLIINSDIVDIDVDFIRTHGYGKCGKYAMLSVQDTGSGIDADTKDRIFEPFFTTKEVGRGTGLGLSISYGIIKQHNGYIDVFSEVGKGTVFKIYLPLIEGRTGGKKGMIGDSVAGGNENILIVEDNLPARKALKNLLESMGYIVTEAENGDDAISKLGKSRDKIRLAIIDVIMLGKDGKEIYDRMLNVASDIKVVFTSSYANDALTDQRILEEGLESIIKPSSPRELLVKVRELLDE